MQKENLEGLPKNLTRGERAHLQLPDLSRLPRVPPVADQLSTASEFERNQAILMRWGNFNSVLTEMIVPITTGDSLARVSLIVAGSAQQSSAASSLLAAGANLDRVDFLVAPSNSVWIRDYGPRFVSADNRRVIVDHQYNRPRPLDNQLPMAIAALLNEDLHDLPLVHGGGNFHLFANGQAYMTDLIVDENPGYTPQDVIDLYESFLGVDLTLLPALPASFDSTQHLDMWFLPVDDRTVIIGDYSSPPAGVDVSPATAEVISVTEFAVQWMEARGYTVLRTPGWRSQGVGSAHHTYTNAVIVNDLVLICRFNQFAAQNAQARAVFEQAFPTRDIVAVDCSAIIGAAGALHCIVKHQPAPAFRLAMDRPAATVCAPATQAEALTLTVSVQGMNGLAEPVRLSASGEPPGVVSQFDPVEAMAPAEVSWTLTVHAGASAGTSDISVSGAGGQSMGLPAAFSLTLDTPLSGPALLSPPDLAIGIELDPVLEWGALAAAQGYWIQLASDADFEHIVVDRLISTTVLELKEDLAGDQDYFWRVLARNACGDGSWSVTRRFRTRFLLEPEPHRFRDRFELAPEA